MRLGVDFGTTRTVVSAVMDGRYPVATFDLGSGYSDHLPGFVGRTCGKLCFGTEALTAARMVRSIKRTLAPLGPDDSVVELGQNPPTALQVATAYLSWVREMVLHHSNLEVRDEVLEAHVAVPANASGRQRYLTLEAFKAAGFSVLGMMNEPTAAAIEYAHRQPSGTSQRSSKRYLVVYDLGGGTFDTSAVSLAGNRFDLLASEGIGELGGDDFDQVICSYALETMGALEVDPATLPLLLERARDAKEGLRASSRRLLVDFGDVVGAREPAVLDVAELARRSQPLVDRTLEMVDRLFAGLRDHGIDPESSRELAALYVVGGGASFAPVSKALRARYKRKLVLSPQPHAATALGLAIAADPEAGLHVREAVTRHFGVWREADEGRRKVFDPIFLKDTAPTEGDGLVVRRSYRPAHAVGHLRYLECSAVESGEPGGDLTPWGEIRFPYDPSIAEVSELSRLPADRRDDVAGEEIIETYTYTPDGTIAVEIANATHGYARRYVLGAMR